MKKLLILFAMAAICAMAHAQSDEMYQKTWGKGRYSRIAYNWAQTADEYSPIEQSKFSLALTKGTVYYFPKTPIAGLLRIGIDATWMDAQVSKYGNGYDRMDWTSRFDPIVKDYDDDEEDDEPFFDLDKIGTWGASFAMGVGPNISIAPFALTDIKAMQPLRLSVYFHYDPTAQLYMRVQNGDIELSTAFCNMMDLGVNLQYNKIGIGYEARWGNGKFKPLDFSSFIGEDEGLGTEKYKRRFANNRLYIQFKF